MRHRFLLVTLVLVTAALLISCNAVDKVHSQQKTQLAPETTYADGARRITIPELEELMKNKEVLVLDVRNQAMYDSGHIPGSRLIPLGDVPKRMHELNSADEIVVHCRSGVRSAQAVGLLMGAGFRKIYNLKGGVLAWADQVDPTMPKY